MGIGEAGMGELPIWDGVDADATRGMSFEDQYLWPEEKEEIERKEKDEEEAGWEGARGQAWAKGAGKLDLSLKRQADYQDVEDVLLTGRRLKRPPKVTFDVSELAWAHRRCVSGLGVFSSCVWRCWRGGEGERYRGTGGELGRKCCFGFGCGGAGIGYFNRQALPPVCLSVLSVLRVSLSGRLSGFPRACVAFSLQGNTS